MRFRMGVFVSRRARRLQSNKALEGKLTRQKGETLMDKHLIAEMKWPETEKAIKRSDTVVLPLGACEQNGPHNPAGGDSIVAGNVASRLASRTGILVAPTMPFGDSSLHARFPGTISLRSATLAAVLKDTCRSLARHGVRRFLILNGHGPNNTAVKSVAYELQDEGLLVVLVDWWALGEKLYPEMAITEDLPTEHGSELSTSVLMALAPGLVDLSLAKVSPARATFAWKYSFRPGTHTNVDMLECTEQGVVGDPLHASAEQGERLIEKAIEYLVELVGDMRKADLPKKRTQ